MTFRRLLLFLSALLAATTKMYFSLVNNHESHQGLDVDTAAFVVGCIIVAGIIFYWPGPEEDSVTHHSDARKVRR